jgi:hypothetical protein
MINTRIESIDYNDWDEVIPIEPISNGIIKTNKFVNRSKWEKDLKPISNIKWYELDQAIRGWVVKSNFESDLDNYQKLKDEQSY